MGITARFMRRIAVGRWVGGGAPPKTVTLGWRAKLVIIYDPAPTVGVWVLQDTDAGAFDAIRLDDAPSVSVQVGYAITDTGFTGPDGAGQTFAYLATE